MITLEKKIDPLTWDNIFTLVVKEGCFNETVLRMALERLDIDFATFLQLYESL